MAEGGELGDDDIDQILAAGQNRTKELNAKYEKLGIDDLQKFTSESAYEWNGEDFANRKKDIGMNWINPAKRERKEQIYSIDKYYKQALQTGGRTADAKPKAPRAPKQVPVHDYQFYPHDCATCKTGRPLTIGRRLATRFRSRTGTRRTSRSARRSVLLISAKSTRLPSLPRKSRRRSRSSLSRGLASGTDETSSSSSMALVAMAATTTNRSPKRLIAKPPPRSRRMPKSSGSVTPRLLITANT